ncbi:MarR family transcriptional regulator [Streptomyces sp900105755]|uniref:MarR family transcriptional regulator n=1 Tax=Streptomyces sp. 900105755 TaxID=3154389 RepID=A0ABV1T987_9ACTN
MSAVRGVAGASRALQHDELTSDTTPATAEPGISYAIGRLQTLVFAAITERVAPYGLTTLQFTSLSVLNRHGTPLSNSQLARRSFMTPQSMHEVIKRLEGEGLIKRNPHPDHARKLLATLTAKGRRVLAECEAAVAEWEETLLEGFSEEERAAFLRMIKCAVNNVHGGFEDPGPAAEDRR